MNQPVARQQTIHPPQRQLVLNYVAAIGVPERKWTVFNDHYRVFLDMVLSLPHCRDLGESDVTSIVVDQLMDYSRKSEAEPPIDFASRAGNRLIDYFESFPRKYLVQITLPGMPNWGEYSVELSEHIAVKGTGWTERPGYENALARSLLLLEEKQTNPSVQLECWTSGYASSSLDSPAAAEALAMVKQATFLLVFTQATLDNRWSTGFQADASLTDVLSDEKEKLQLPAVLTRYLGGLQPNNDSLKFWDDEKGVVGEMRDPTTDTERVSALQTKTASVRRFFSRTHLPGYSRIAAAIEWYQDSLLNDDQTMAFLAACIGLESIFGEEDGGMNELSRRLADRYAFMLGKDREDRSRLAREFADVLRVRGELVHARSTRLKARDRRQLSVVRKMLWESIRHEIKPFLAP